jgi:site-specific recombinase XerD
MLARGTVDTLLTQHIDAFLRWIGSASPHTRRTYRNDLLHFCRWYEESNGQPVRMDDLTPVVAVLYKSALTGRLRMKPATVKRRMSSLSRFGTWAVEAGLIAESPTARVRIPPAPGGAPRPLDRAVVQRLLEAAQQDSHKLAARNYALLRLLVDTKIHIAALVALRMADLGWAEESQQATLTVASGRGGRLYTLTLPPQTLSALEAYLEVRPVVADNHLFVSTHGTAMSTESLRQVVNKYARLAGIAPADVSPQMLRY